MDSELKLWAWVMAAQVVLAGAYWVGGWTALTVATQAGLVIGAGCVAWWIIPEWWNSVRVAWERDRAFRRWQGRQ